MDARDGLGVMCLLLFVLLSVGVSGVGAAATEPVDRFASETVNTVQSVDLDGAGTKSDPYEIADVDDLQEMENDTSAHYELVSDINATASGSLDGGDGFDPVGESGAPFNGSLDGNGHTITGLTINRSDTEEVGLFGFVDREATIVAVRLNESSVTGGNKTGALAGRFRGTATNVSASGTVDGDRTVGGLVGLLEQEGTIQDARSNGSANGSARVGGLLGAIEDDATLNRTYTISDPNATSGSEGGLVAKSSGSISVSHSYYQNDIESDSAEGLERTSDELTGTDPNMNGFAFPRIWVTFGEDAYPELSRFHTRAVDGSAVSAVSGTIPPETRVEVAETGMQRTADGQGQFTLSLVEDIEYTINATATVDGATLTDSTTVTVDNDTTLSIELSPSLNGSGTEAAPYEISSAQQAQVIAEDRTAHYDLIADVNASNTSGWNDGAGFAPIGEYDNDSVPGFSGTLDGNGHNLTGLTIDREDEEYVGLFGELASTGTVRNLTLSGIDVRGGLVAGGIAAHVSDNATITAVTVRGSVSGELNVGAVAGRSAGQIEQTAAHASVEARERSGVLGSNAGGLVGHTTGTVARSYATGSVDAAGETAGGLVGLVDDGGEVVDSYATGDVTADRHPGGLVGELSSDRIVTSYATGSVSGTDAGALVGSGSPAAVTAAYWLNGTTPYGTATTNRTGLSQADLTGAPAWEAMAGLDFETTWVPTDERAPLLDWQVVSNNVTVTPGAIEGTQTATASQTVRLVDGTNLTASAAGQFEVEATDASAVRIDGTTVSALAAGAATISANGGTDTASVEVTAVEPAAFNLSVDSVTDVVAGENLTVTATVTNVGEAYGTETIALTRDGSELASTDRSLGAEESATVELTWQTSAGDAGEQQLTVTAGDQETSTSATVTEPQEDVAGSNETDPANNGTASNSTTQPGETGTGDGGGGGLLSSILGALVGLTVGLVKVVGVLLGVLVVLGLVAVLAIPRLLGVDSISDVQVNTDAIRADLAETFGPVASKLPIDVDAVIADLAGTARSISASVPIDVGAIRADVQDTIDSVRRAIQQRIG